jgi:hypothetical protein
VNPNVLVAAITAGSSLAIAITALLLNDRGFGDLRGEMASLRREMDNRFADLRSEINHGFEDLTRYFEARFNGLEERIERLEHPVQRGR